MRIDGPQFTGSFNLNGDTVADLDVFATTSSFNLMTASMATTGSNVFVGTQTSSGSIVPSVNNTYDLGSPTHQFRHVYISSGSLYVNGTKVLGSTAQELQITTDAGQSFKILESSSDTITLQSADGNITLATSGGGDVIMDPTNGVIGLKGTVTIYTGNKITSSDGNSIQFGNGIAVTGSIVSTTTSLVSGSSQITYSGLSGVPSDIISGSGQLTTLGIATTGSNTFNGNLTVTGFIDTQELRTTYISSSILYRSGSTKFGDELTDTHSFTGSILISGSISVPGSNLVSGSSQVLNGSGVFSGSAQLPSGIVSSSAQTIANLPSGIVSSSAQTIANLPSGTVSGSVQVDVMSTTNIARLATTGSNVFTGAITGTSATFSASTNALNIGNSQNSAIALSTFGKTSTSGYATANNYLQIGAGENATSSTRLIGFGYSITANTNQPAYIGYIETSNAGETKGSLIFGTRDVTTDTAPTTRLTIASTGAATFNGNVTVGSAIAATNVEFNLSGVSGKAKRIQFQDGVTGQWLLGQGAASETSAFELYNATGTIVLSVNKSTNISTFNGSTTFAAKTNGNNVTLSSNGTALEMYNTSGAVKNWQISSQTHNSQCMDFTPSTANGGTTYSTPILTIDGEQNRVGIGTGTSRPLTLFHTYSATDNLSTFQAGSSSGIQLRFRHGSTLTGFINSNTTNIFSVYNTNSTELLSITPGGDVFHYGGTSNQGLWTYVQVGSCTGQNTFNFDVTVGDEGGGGNIFKVEAGFAHYHGMTYNCLAEFYVSSRGLNVVITDVIRIDTAFGGSFTATKSDAATLRVTKNAGSYPGGGRYWIRVTKVTY